MKRIVFLLFICAFVWEMASAQQGAGIRSNELVYDFGTIAEEDGPVSHVFQVENTGTAPLVITRITVSCGCTKPEGPKTPIAPGKTGDVKITYDPKGRPGPFIKTVSIYSNGKEGSYKLSVKGKVSPKKVKPAIIYPYAVGPLKMHTKTILYSGIRPEEVRGEKIMVKNEGSVSLTIQLGKYPDFLMIDANPQVLVPGETGEINILIDAKEAKKLGRVTNLIPFVVRSAEPKETNGEFRVSANIIEDFSRLTSEDKINAPVISLQTDTIDFGVLNGHGGKVSRILEIANTGKSDLLIRSIGSDDERIDVTGGRKTIKPGNTASFKVVIRGKEIKASLESVLNIVSNDPSSPVRLLKVTAKQ